MGSRVQASVQLRGKGSSEQKQHQDGTRRPRSPEDGRHPGMQSLALGEVPTTEASHGEGVCGQAGHDPAGAHLQPRLLCGHPGCSKGERERTEEHSVRDHRKGLRNANRKPVPEAHNNQSHRLTATIFLNKDWQVDSDGGGLRLSPSTSTLATIPPVFDRVVFYPNHLVCPTILPATRDSLSCSVVYKG